MTFKRIWTEITEWLQDDATWEAFGIAAIRIIIIVIIAKLAVWLLHKTINRIVLERTDKHKPAHIRRMTTIGKLVKNVVSYVIYFIAGLLILAEFNINLGPLLAGAGIAGIAIGFGAQSLVKDILTGFFIVIEDQFAVGDVIQTGQFKGTVELIGLRTTRIQSWTGEVHIIPNGMINEVTNFSINNSLAVLDISIAYEADIEEAIRIIHQTAEETENENLVKTPEVLGVQTLAASSVTIRVIAECRPNTHMAVARIMNKRFKEALDQHGIEIPYPKMVTYHRAYEGAQ